jgi:DNA-binding CsgD family transcriptional regulator
LARLLVWLERTESGDRSEIYLQQDEEPLWEMVSAHIAAGARLRMRLDQVNLDESAVVFDKASGAMDVHDEALKSAGRRRRLMQLIEARRHADKIAGDDPMEAMKLWQGLVDGRWSVLDVVDTDGRAYTVLRENALDVRSRIALSERERQVAFLVGRGHHVKLVAYELGVSPSTVRSQLRSALRKLNVEDRQRLCRLVARIDEPDSATPLDDLGILALADAPLEIPGSLTGAEREVATLVYEGLTNKEIGARRGTAGRTVANQLASIYRKTEVSCREDLVRLLSGAAS